MASVTASSASYPVHADIAVVSCRMISVPSGPHHTSILYHQADAIAYRPGPASQLIMSTRYGPNHTPYPLATGSTISTTASNSLQPLTHLPSPHTPFFLPQSTQHSSTFQQRHPSTMAPYGQVLPSSLHVANSPSLAGNTVTGSTSYVAGQQQQRPTTMNYNVGYSGTVSSTAASFGSQQQQLPQSQHVLHTTSLQASPESRSQTVVFPTPESSGFSTSPQITQHQQPQPQPQQQWNFNS